MKVKYMDALIIGGGLAGLRSAIAAAEKGLNVTVISLVPVKRSHSAAAQGGMQASLANANKAEGDNEDVHFEDTVKGSDWGCDQEVARMFTQTAPKAIRQLASWGVPWTRVRKGEQEITIGGKKVKIVEDEKKHGLIHSRNFGGTKKWRTCYTADATGHTMLYAVANEAMKRDVNIEDRKEAVRLIHHNGRCYGAIVRDLVNGELVAYVARGTMVATGGAGRIYETTTNAVINNGTGLGLALETGMVSLGNMEAIQFHPTPLVPSGILITEGCRGDGGVLRDKDGYRFMPDYEPDKKDLASRDVVSRRMEEHIRKGKGVHSPYGDHLWLDISVLGRKHIEKNLRDVQEICIYFAGIDPADEGKKGWIPVKPMHHYTMGGIRVKPTGASPDLDGLFCAGEASCWDLHGFNRLGGNSVSEAVVSGMVIGGYFADYCSSHELDIDTKIIEEFYNIQQKQIDDIINNKGGVNIYKVKNAMKKIMQDKVGVFRNGKDLKDAVDELKELYGTELKKVSITSKSKGINPELDEVLMVTKMLKVALCVAKGALERTESRGAHTREDYPKRDDVNWLNRTLAYWKNEDDIEPTLKYEPIDIKNMEMAPGFRGYGDKGLIIHHPDTAKREEVINKIKAENEGKDRAEVQEKLMHYELQPEYKTKNERVGDK